MEKEKRTSRLITFFLVIVIAAPAYYLIRQSIDFYVSPEPKTVQQDQKAEKSAVSATENELIEKGLELYRQKEYQKSIEFMLKAIEINPNNASAYNNLCAAYNEIKEFEKAIAACNKAISINPDFGLAKNNLNWAIEQQKKNQ